MLNNYIRTEYGAVVVTRSLSGLSLVVDTRVPLLEEDWDRAIAHGWEKGYELVSDNPKVVGPWEFWDMRPHYGDEAA